MKKIQNLENSSIMAAGPLREGLMDGFGPWLSPDGLHGFGVMKLMLDEDWDRQRDGERQDFRFLQEQSQAGGAQQLLDLLLLAGLHTGGVQTGHEDEEGEQDDCQSHLDDCSDLTVWCWFTNLKSIDRDVRKE